MRIVQEFKQFVSRGNIVDIAIGFIIGAAFGKISTSLASDIIMPPIGLFLDNMHFEDLAVPLRNALVDEEGKIIKEPVAVYYGRFLQTILNFFIISLAVFLIFKLAAAFKKKEPPKPEATPVKSDEAILLEQIRDLLKEQQVK